MLQTVTSYSPTTNEPIAQVTQASPKDYDKVIESARSAYQKWCEVHDKYPTEETSSFFIDRPVLKDATQEILLTEIKNNFWLPEDPEEYLYLEPELVYTGGDGEEIKSVTGSKMPAISH